MIFRLSSAGILRLGLIPAAAQEIHVIDTDTVFGDSRIGFFKFFELLDRGVVGMRGKAGFLDGTFEGRLGTGTLLGRPFESGRASGTFTNGEAAHVERAAPISMLGEQCGDEGVVEVRKGVACIKEYGADVRQRH